jgi:ribonuclease J
MLFNGLVVASIAVDGSGAIRGEPRISAPGLIDADDEQSDRLADELCATIEDLPAGLRRDDAALSDAARAALRRIFGRRIGKRPMVEVHLIRV